MLLKTAM